MPSLKLNFSVKIKLQIQSLIIIQVEYLTLYFSEIIFILSIILLVLKGNIRGSMQDF